MEKNMTKIAPKGEMVELRVRVTPEHYQLLNRIAGSDPALSRQSLALVGGQMLTEALLQHNVRLIRERDREAQTEKAAHDVVEMFARGMPITAIAALTKKPYSLIARLIAEKVDLEVRYARELA
jgi:hypothetical protein